MKFYEILTKLCTENKMSLTELAKSLEISSSNPTNWKNGFMPNVEALIKISRYFNVTTDYLLGIEKAPAEAEAITQEEYDMIAKYRYLSDVNKEVINSTINILYSSDDERINKIMGDIPNVIRSFHAGEHINQPNSDLKK